MDKAKLNFAFISKKKNLTSPLSWHTNTLLKFSVLQIQGHYLFREELIFFLSRAMVLTIAHVTCSQIE
jgi:hypothetical protein